MARRKHSRNGKMPIVLHKEVKNLPEGWEVEVRPRKSTLGNANTYKCYISPTGSKFYSLRKVYGHLETEMPRFSKSTEMPRLSKSTEMPRTSKSTKPGEIHVPEDLPPGWICRLKVRPNGRHKDPYYTCPVSGYTFRSKLDVLRYLETGIVGPRAIKPPRSGNGNLTDMDETISALIASKKQKLERSRTRRHFFTGQSSKGNEKVNQEPILEPMVAEESPPRPKYTSIEDADGYPDDEWPGLANIIPCKDDDDTKKNKYSGTQAQNGSASTAPLSVTSSENQQHQKLPSGNKVTPSVSAEVAFPENQKQDMEKGVETRRSSRRTQLGSSKPLAHSDLNKSQGPMLRSRRMIVSALPATVVSPENLKKLLEKGSRQVTPALPARVTSLKKVEKVVPAVCEEVAHPKKQNKQEKEVEKDVLVVPAVLVSPEKEQDKLEKAVEEIVPPLPAVEVSTEEQPKLEKEVPKVVPAPAASPVAVSPRTEQHKHNKVEEKCGKRKAQPTSCKSNSGIGKQLNLPRRASKRLAGFNADLVPELVIRKQKSKVTPQVEDSDWEFQELHERRCNSETNKSDSSSDVAKVPAACGQEALNKGGDPLGVEELKYKTVEITVDQAEPAGEKVNQKPEFSFTSPFGESWPDPTFEFAVKTLTGVIPVDVDDNLMVQAYFEQHISSVSTQNHNVLPDTSTDGFHKTNDLLRFDSVEKPSSQPTLQDSVFPGGSGGMLNFGGDMHQRPTTDGNLLHFGGNVARGQPTAGPNDGQR